jgi:hypothetical protein
MFPASRIFLLVLLFSVSFPRTGFDLVPRFPSAFFGFGAEGPCAQDFSSCSRQFLRQVNFLGLDLVQRQYLIFLALILTACVLVFNFHCLALGLANLSARPHFSLSVFQPCVRPSVLQPTVGACSRVCSAPSAASLSCQRFLFALQDCAERI